MKRKIEIDIEVYAAVWAKLALAEVYLDDGARFTALERLRQAIALLPKPPGPEAAE